MTWEQLKNHIETMDDHQLKSDVTVHLTGKDEFVAIDELDYVSEEGNDILDPLHPFIVVDI
jgi:hypothetical protein